MCRSGAVDPVVGIGVALHAHVQRFVAKGVAALAPPLNSVPSELSEVAEGDEIWAEYREDGVWYKAEAQQHHEHGLTVIFFGDSTTRWLEPETCRDRLT